MTRVSVALATYNGAEFVGEQLASIAAQTFAPFEIVICDDASTDSTLQCVTEFAKTSPVPVRIYQNPTNLGFIKNFERAISLCQGDLIALSDQDDVWLPSKLEHVVGTFEKAPSCGLVFTDAMIVDRQLAPQGYSVYSLYQKPDLTPGETVPSLIRKIGVLGCTMVFRGKFVPYLLPIRSLAWGHDHWILFQLAILSPMMMVEQPLMYYRRHTSNAGNATPLNKRFGQKIRRMYGNLSLAAYEKDYRMWSDMLAHLETIRQHEQLREYYPALDSGIEKVRQRVHFSEERLKMRRQNRLRRVHTAIRLHRYGDYRRYTPGSRTLIKDIIA